MGIEEKSQEIEVSKLHSLKDFLESSHPSTAANVSINIGNRPTNRTFFESYLIPPPIEIYCDNCEGQRVFRSNEFPQLKCGVGHDLFVSYLCGNCHKCSKRYSFSLAVDSNGSSARAYKYGELPPFGVPVPNKVLRLFGSDSHLFLKGRQCENQGLGVAAFAYYRRVVENNKSALLHEILQVCTIVGADRSIKDEIEAAKREILFSKSMETIKSGLPQSLLISGHNPLSMLHGALSSGLHSESDEDCLEIAHSIRVVLTELVDRISMIRRDNKELSDAVANLVTKKRAK